MTESIAQPGAPWRCMLEARPERNAAARAAADGEAEVTIAIQTRPPRYLSVPPLSWIVPVRKERKVTLDKLGTEIWRLCDGSMTIEGVVDSFSRSHGLTFHEARVAVTGYVKGLIRHGVVAIELNEDAWTG